jgi:dTDP-4-amino-4,6-dideoxygalactose transaminase
LNSIEELYITRSMELKEALIRLEQTGAGVLLLVDEEQVFERTVTDGDLRRLLLAGFSLNARLSDLPKIQSTTISAGQSSDDALSLMNERYINHIPVLNNLGRIVDLLDRRVIDRQILLSTPHMGSAERRYVEEAFNSNWIAPLGPNVDAFERELSCLVGTENAAAVTSGTAAIHLGLRLLGVGLGDKVFCSTLTFVASVNPIIYQGAEPVFIDSEPESWNMSPKALERAFDVACKEGWLPKAVILVNLYGQSADMDPILDLCNFYGVPVLEDAAESLGAKYKDRYSGTFGVLGVFSFNGNKIITTSGGGMLISNNADLIGRARWLSTQARDPAPHYEHSQVGYNYRMSNILAGIGRGQLSVLGERVKARRLVFDTYKNQLEDIKAIEWMPEPAWSYSSRWLTAAVINPTSKVTSRGLISRLAEERIEARPVWKPMHLQPLFSDARYFTVGDESISDKLYENGICLPSGSNMTVEQQGRVVDIIRKAFV